MAFQDEKFGNKNDDNSKFSSKNSTVAGSEFVLADSKSSIIGGERNINGNELSISGAEPNIYEKSLSHAPSDNEPLNYAISISEQLKENTDEYSLLIDDNPDHENAAQYVQSPTAPADDNHTRAVSSDTSSRTDFSGTSDLPGASHFSGVSSESLAHTKSGGSVIERENRVRDFFKAAQVKNPPAQVLNHGANHGSGNDPANDASTSENSYTDNDREVFDTAREVFEQERASSFDIHQQQPDEASTNQLYPSHADAADKNNDIAWWSLKILFITIVIFGFAFIGARSASELSLRTNQAEHINSLTVSLDSIALRIDATPSRALDVLQSITTNSNAPRQNTELTSYSPPGRSGYLIAINNQGRIVAHGTSTSVVGQDARRIVSPSGEPVFANLSQAARASGIAESVVYLWPFPGRVEPTIRSAVARYMPNSGITLIATANIEHLIANSATIFWQQFLTIAIALAICALIFSLFDIRNSAAISKVRNALNKIADGDLASKLEANFVLNGHSLLYAYNRSIDRLHKRQLMRENQRGEGSRNGIQEVDELISTASSTIDQIAEKFSSRIDDDQEALFHSAIYTLTTTLKKLVEINKLIGTASSLANLSSKELSHNRAMPLFMSEFTTFAKKAAHEIDELADNSMYLSDDVKQFYVRCSLLSYRIAVRAQAIDDTEAQNGNAAAKASNEILRALATEITELSKSAEAMSEKLPDQLSNLNKSLTSLSDDFNLERQKASSCISGHSALVKTAAGLSSIDSRSAEYIDGIEQAIGELRQAVDTLSSRPRQFREELVKQSLFIAKLAEEIHNSAHNHDRLSQKSA